MTLPNPPGHQVIASTDRPTVAWGNGVWDQTINRFPNALIRDAQWVTPPDGALCYLDDRDLLMVRRSSAWVVMSSYDVQAGNPVFTTTGSGTFAVNFPRAFAATPVVLVCNGADMGGGLSVQVQAGSVNASGFSGVAYNNSALWASAALRPNWIAVLL